MWQSANQMDGHNSIICIQSCCVFLSSDLMSWHISKLLTTNNGTNKFHYCWFLIHLITHSVVPTLIQTLIYPSKFKLKSQVLLSSDCGWRTATSQVLTTAPSSVFYAETQLPISVEFICFKSLNLFLQCAGALKVRDTSCTNYMKGKLRLQVMWFSSSKTVLALLLS